MSDGVQRYPDAARLDLVERLPEAAPTYDVADPYRWLEDATADRDAWPGARPQDDAATPRQRATWPGRDRLRGRVGELLGGRRGQRADLARRAAVLHAPAADQEHAVLLTVDPDGTERVLLDPMALDPAGTTTLDAWQPTKEGDLLAYQLSEGGTEESVLRVMDVATGEIVDGPIDRARYSPVAWLPGGAGLLLRTPARARAACPTARSSSTAGSGCTGSAPTRPRTCWSSARAATRPNYYGVSVSPRRALAARRRRPRAPRRATTCGSPT